MTDRWNIALKATRSLPEGDVAVQLGTSGLGIPAGAPFIHAAGGKLLLVLFERRVFGFVQSGMGEVRELWIPETYQGLLLAGYFASRR
jgi:hypothetical protein